MVITDLLTSSEDLYNLAKNAIENGVQQVVIEQELIDLEKRGLDLSLPSLSSMALLHNKPYIFNFLSAKQKNKSFLHDELKVQTEATSSTKESLVNTKSDNVYEKLEQLRQRSKELNASMPKEGFQNIKFDEEMIEKNTIALEKAKKEMTEKSIKMEYDKYPYSDKAPEISHLYIDLLDEEKRVEPEILEQRKKLAQDLGYGLANASEYPFDRQDPSYYKQFASSRIFSDYNTTLQQSSTQNGIIFEWTLKKIYDLSELVKSNEGDFVNSEYENKPEYKHLFKAKSLPKFKSKSELMLYATNYFYNNFDSLKHLFLEDNKEQIKKTLIDDLKLIQLEDSKDKALRLTNQFVNHIQNYFHSKKDLLVYRLSNEKEKIYYNDYMDTLIVDIMKEQPKLFSSNIYSTILSNMIGLDAPLNNERKKEIDFLIEAANLTPQKNKAFYATLVEYATKESNFGLNSQTTNLGDTLEYILKNHLSHDVLSMNDIKKFPIFLNFLKNNRLKVSWKEEILDMIDFKSFDSTEKNPLIAELVVDYIVPEWIKSLSDDLLDIRESVNTQATFKLFWNQFKNDISEQAIDSILSNSFKVKTPTDILSSINFFNQLLDNPPTKLNISHINQIADFLFSAYNLPSFNEAHHNIIEKVFSHPLYVQNKNKEKIAEHYYYNLDTLLNHSQLIDRNLSHESKLKTIQGIIDNPNNYPNFQYTLDIFKSLYKHNQGVIDDTFYKKYNSLTFLVNTLKEQAICTPFLDAYLSINQDTQWINSVDKNNKKPVEYVKRRKNIAEERVYDLLLNHGATIELSAFNKLMISFSSLFKSEAHKDFEYIESIETQVHNKYDLLLEEVGTLSKKSETLLSQHHHSFSDSEFEMIGTRIQSIYQNAIKIIDIAQTDEGLIEPEKLFYLENTITKYLPESFNAFTSGMKSTEILEDSEKEEKAQYLIKELSQQVSILSMKTLNISKEYVNEIVEAKMLDSAKHTQFLKAKS
jgi:hypothetical protein